VQHVPRQLRGEVRAVEIAGWIMRHPEALHDGRGSFAGRSSRDFFQPDLFESDAQGSLAASVP
jgi:hypothetical protein